MAFMESVSVSAILLVSPADSVAIRGDVVAEDNSRLSGAEVEAIDHQTRVRTRANGEYEIIVAGRPSAVRLVTRAIGFHPESITVRFHAGTSIVHAGFQLRRVALVLDTVRTIASPLARVGFEGRRLRAGGGRFLSTADIRKLGASRVTELLDQVPGVRVISGTGTTPSEGLIGAHDARVVEIDRGPRRIDARPCPVKYVLDGAQYEPSSAGIDVEIPAARLIGVEVYSGGAVPIEFSRIGAACGVVILWTETERSN